MNRKGLAFKLAFFILGGTAMVFAAAFAYNYNLSRKLVLEQVEGRMAATAAAAINRMAGILENVQADPAYLARRLGAEQPDRPALERSLREMLASNADIYGTTASFEPYAFSKNIEYFAPYAFRKGDGVELTSLNTPGYRYYKWDWYMLPRSTGKALWSEPYYDDGGGNALMCTYSVPVYRKGSFAGVVTADITLERLLKMVSSISLYKTGRAFLVSRKGVFITHPDQSLVMKKTMLEYSAGDAGLTGLARMMLSGREGFAGARLPDGRMCRIYSAPLAETGWSLAIVVPEAELFHGVRSLSRNILLIGLAGFGLLAVIVFLIVGKVVRPVHMLAERTSEIARGNLDVPVPLVDTGDEVGELSRSFENMRSALKEYIANLSQTTAAKERLESELKIAHNIQMSSLPKKFPLLMPGRPFELDACLEPAKEVGGDFYDFFMLDKDTLFFSIGDVSGKGVPAALFMAVTKTLIKGLAAPRLEPSAVLEKVNGELAKDNDMMMFVTVFCAALNLRTGELRYSNAGHLPPLLFADGASVFMDLPKGVPLGVQEGAVFSTRSLRLAPGDGLLLYTDGITESADYGGALFGDDRLLALAPSVRDAQPSDMIKSVFGAAKVFAGNEPQADDMTALALRYKGARPGGKS